MLSAETLGAELPTQRLGRRICVLPEVDSTNTFAFELAGHPGQALSSLSKRKKVQVYERTPGDAANSDYDGLVVFAERQSSGRGRLGRAWHCPTGAGLMLTILLREPVGATTPAAWMMLAGVAVVRGIIHATDVTPSLRWPNDVYAADRKLAGILVETRREGAGSELVAIGIGINCLQQPGHFPPDIRARATSLDLLSDDPIDRHAVARSVLEVLDAELCMLMHRDENRLIEQWQSHSADIGARVELQCEGHTYRGRIIDVHPRDGVLVQLDDGGRRQFDPAVTTRA